MATIWLSAEAVPASEASKSEMACDAFIGFKLDLLWCRQTLGLIICGVLVEWRNGAKKSKNTSGR